MKPTLLIGLLALSACDVDRALTGPGGPDAGCTFFELSKLDVLLLIDNSSGMVPMQDNLIPHLGEFLQPFLDQAGFDLHFGVVTSDYGAGAGAPGCQPSPGGELGRLQPIGANAAAGCKPPVGAPFVRYNTTGENNLPTGQDLAATLGCMVSVGDTGCGFEHQLESVYAALHNTTENAGFLRPDAALLVVFYTNEDDCSAPPTSNLFDKNRTAEYGYESSFRCARFGVLCGNQPPPYGSTKDTYINCTPSDAPELYNVKRYTDFFAQLKPDRRRVALAALDADHRYFRVILSNPGTPAGENYKECPQIDETSGTPCTPVVAHTCFDQRKPWLFGDPAIRLNAVVGSTPYSRMGEICDDALPTYVQQIGRMGVSAATCL